MEKIEFYVYQGGGIFCFFNEILEIHYFLEE